MSSYSLPIRWAPAPVDGMPSSKPPSWRYGNWRTLERGNHERDMRLCGHYWPTQCRQVDIDEPDPRSENLDHFTPARSEERRVGKERGSRAASSKESQ